MSWPQVHVDLTLRNLMGSNWKLLFRRNCSRSLNLSIVCVILQEGENCEAFILTERMCYKISTRSPKLDWVKMPPAASNGADMAEAGGGRKDGPKELILKSPFGSASKVYTWPLKKGRGSLRKSEDKEDEAAEIVETIK